MLAVAYSVAFHAVLLAGERAVRYGLARVPDRGGMAPRALAEGGERRDA